eukprot:CAMPEP_0117697266 /NCGR_PEP_ID=MMETSP0804-20121206/29132_1 /TAXON_ID=1074897 /ORGANISM="Tetraselmis astigmatica, Strain CCMP880" /LENGTH=92 /DNA_ID=CAMNT_0005511495 /DNA_START=469 /DNA_END=743 /DNA_ORIENTATION=-
MMNWYVAKTRSSESHTRRNLLLGCMTSLDNTDLRSALSGSLVLSVPSSEEELESWYWLDFAATQSDRFCQVMLLSGAPVTICTKSSACDSFT